MNGINDTIVAFKTFATESVSKKGGADTVAQFGESQAEISGHVWKAWGSRGGPFNKINRETRQKFIDALKQQFGADRVSDIPGKVLELLNISAFDLDANDRVRSDKPLTARRIKLVTDMVGRLATPEQRIGQFHKIATRALSEGCTEQLASLVKKGTTPRGLVDFISRHFGGETGRLLKSVMVGVKDNERVCETIAKDLMNAVQPVLVKAGVTRADLQRMGKTLEQLDRTRAGNVLWRQLAKSFVIELNDSAEEIAIDSFAERLVAKLEQLDGLKSSRKNPTIGELLQSERGRDILLKTALNGLWHLPSLNSKSYYRLSAVLSQLAGHARELGSERAYLLASHLGNLVGEESGVNTRLARKVLCTFLKQYTNLTDADLTQIPTAKLKDFAMAAADDSLVHDRKTISDEIERYAKTVKEQNYTDEDVHELMTFAHEADFTQVVRQREPAEGAQGNAPVQQPEQEPVQGPAAPGPAVQQKHADALKKNEIVCKNLALLGKLFHRDDVWTYDALGRANAVLDTLKNNEDLVSSLVENWNKEGTKMSTFSLATQYALNLLVDPDIGFPAILIPQGDNKFTDRINRINLKIMDYRNVETEDGKLKVCQEIADMIDTLADGLSGKLQEMLTKHLNEALKGDGEGGTFNGLPEGQRPETADLLQLAKNRHSPPSHETKEQRELREKEILDEYCKLVLDPQAGGFGTLIRSLANNYVKELDTREKCAMLSGVLLSITPETLTEMMKDASPLDLASMAAKNMSVEVLKNYFKDIKAPDKDGKLTAPQQKIAGEVASGLIRGAGPVFQKMVQMFGAEKLPKCLQQAVKDCKSNLKPIPDSYVKAKLADIVYRSRGSIKAFTDFKSIGAASIAEAFECTYIDQDNHPHSVVVKMLRPDVRGRMEREIAAIKKSVTGAGEGALRSLQARITSLLGELDFTEERENIKRCQDIYGSTSFKKLHSVKLAKGCPQLPDVLIMEKAPGETFQKYMDSTTKRLDGLLSGHMNKDADGHYEFSVMDKDTHEELANELKGLYEDVRKRQANLQRLVQTWFSNAIFGNGRFHGDLHGGNIMVDENGEVTVIDFGNAPVFAQSDRKNVVKLLVAAMRGDADAVLKATYALVSDDSKAVLTNTNKRTALKNKLLEMFKLGGIWNAAERIKAVFGELSRAGIEIPAALYNFTEALGRVQQLSDSMAATLERISGALPYLREHRFEDVSEADQKILTLGENKNSLKSIDKFIDETLAYHIRRMHRDEPNLSDAEIIRRLKKSIEKGELNEVFDAFGTSSNPVTAGPLHDLVNAIAAGNVSGILRGGHELAAESLLFDSEEDPKKKTVAELFQTKSKVLVEKILDPYISLNPALGPLKDELNGLLETIYSGDSTAPSNIFITFRINLNGGNILDANASEFDENAQLNSDEFVSCPYEEVRQRLAHCKVQMAVLIRDRILPEIAKAFKTRLRQIAKDFDVSGLKPPVKMLDSMASSVKWHVLPTIKLGGTNAIGLGASLLWKLVKEKTFDKPIEIRANFGMEIADFRSFACEGRGRIRATKDKQLEFTSSLNTLSVHNAEAWRALVESLRTDLHKDEKTFWESLAGQKIAAILGLGEGVTLNDVEKASPLTSEYLQVVLAAHDMYKLDHTAPSIRAIKSHLAPAANMSFADVTYDTFKGKLEAAFTAVCGRSVAGAFGIDKADTAQALETLMKSLYGKVIVRMSEIGAADPYYAVTGKVPGDTDVQRWMVAASRDVLAAEKVLKVDQLSKLEDILVGKLDRQYVDALAALGLPSTSLVRTAMLLRGLDDKAKSDKLVAFLLGQIGDKGATFRLPPDQSAIGREDFNRCQAGARFLDGLKEAAKVPDAARDEVMKRVRDIGYGLLPIATDDGLYKRYKQGEALDDALQNDLMVRIRQANYVNNPKPPPDDEEELGHVLAFWNAKKNCEGQPEPEQELDPQEEELPSEEKYRGFFGILRGIGEMIGD